VKFNIEKVTQYLKNGAQPTPRVVRLLAEQKIELPSWVKQSGQKNSSVRNPEKLRKNQPKETEQAEQN
jgi:ribosomal protein S16